MVTPNADFNAPAKPRQPPDRGHAWPPSASKFKSECMEGPHPRVCAAAPSPPPSSPSPPPLPTPPNSPPLPSFTPAPTAVAATVTRPPPPAGPGLAWPRPPAGAASGVGSVTHDTPPPPTTPPRPPPPPLSPRRHARAPTIAVGDAQTSATGASGGWRCIACSFFPDWRSPRSAPTAHPSPLTRAFLSPASYSWFL